MNTTQLLNLPVQDVMTKELITVHETDLMATVEELLTSHKINHIPVIDEDGLIKGILTKNDLMLLKDWGSKLNLKASIKANYQILHSNTAKDKMSTNIITVSPTDNLEHCAKIFRDNTFHALPVTSDGALVGMITTYDLLNVAYPTS